MRGTFSIHRRAKMAGTFVFIDIISLEDCFGGLFHVNVLLFTLGYWEKP
jgi:hypothetical protein